MVSKKNALGATTACMATVALALGAGVAQADTGGPPTFCLGLGAPQLSGLQTAHAHGAPITVFEFCKVTI